MSPVELVTNAKLFEKLDFKNNPVLRAALAEAIQKASTSKKNMGTLKTSVAAAAVKDEKLSNALKGLQEKQIDNLKGAEGNWLVLGDRSGSMAQSIEIAKEVAGVLARSVKGEVHLVFFDTSPTYYNVTGKSLDEIKNMTRGVNAGGSTSIGCGLQMALEKKLDLSGIAIVSDGGDNTNPFFNTAYKQYCQKMGVDLPVYFYRVSGDADALSRLCDSDGIQLQKFDLTGSVDYYSLPNLIQTMRPNRYSLLDEVMTSPFRRLDDVLTRTTEMGVFRNVASFVS